MEIEENNLITIYEDRVRSLFDDCIVDVRHTNDTNSECYVFNNQIETAKDIIYNFYTKSVRWCLLFAEMQSGKSGTFFSVPYIIQRNQSLVSKLGIDVFDKSINVFLLTGMNEKELINQFVEDIKGFTGRSLQKNVLHNAEMRKFLNKEESTWLPTDKQVIDRMKKNSLILIDESHYGSDKNQILDKFLRKILKINPNGDSSELEKNNQYVVSISATPMAEFLNCSISNFKKKIIPLKNANGYYGITQMFDNNKVQRSYDLGDNGSVDNFINRIIKLPKPGYILVRCTQKQQNRVLERLNDTKVNPNIIPEPINYDRYSKSTILDNQGINDILSQPTNSKQIIFLKGLLRAGKRVFTDNIVMVHDTSESKVDTTAQSLLGRCCGYFKNDEIEICCDYDAAKKYRDWVDSGFSLNKVPDKSKNIKGQNGLHIKCFSPPIEFDVSLNTFIHNSLSSRAAKGQASLRNINILKSLNNSIINDIINNGTLDKEYTIGTIFKVDINKHNDWKTGGKSYTSYQKQYLDVLTNNIFMGDYKPDETELGKIIFSGAYEVQNKRLLVSFGRVEMSSVSADEKSMYHESNYL